MNFTPDQVFASVNMDTYTRMSAKPFWIYHDTSSGIFERSRFNPAPPPDEVQATWIVVEDFEEKDDEVRQVSVDGNENVMIWTNDRIITVHHAEFCDEVTVMPRYPGMIGGVRFPQVNLEPSDDIDGLRDFFHVLRLLVDRRGLGEIVITDECDISEKGGEERILYYLAVYGNEPTHGIPEVVCTFWDNGRVDTEGKDWPVPGNRDDSTGESISYTWAEACTRIIQFFSNSVLAPKR